MFQMLLQHNLFLLKYLKGLTVSKVHNMVPMLTTDKMMTKVNLQVTNLFPKVIKL